MRRIQFRIPGQPSVIVVASEVGDGTIRFDLAIDGASCRPTCGGFFFDFGHDTTIPGRSAGDDVTDQAYGDVDDLGHGANMKGGGRDGYDVGVEFGTQGIGKDDISSASFTLASTDGTALTLDMIAHMEFGAPPHQHRHLATPGIVRRRSAVTAPAAPDANDDTAATLEDTAVTIDAVGNDTDGDGQAADDHGGRESAPRHRLHRRQQDRLSGRRALVRHRDSSPTRSTTATAAATSRPSRSPSRPSPTRPSSSWRSAPARRCSRSSSTSPPRSSTVDGSESYALKVSGLPSGVTLLGAPGGLIAESDRVRHHHARACRRHGLRLRPQGRGRSRPNPRTATPPSTTQTTGIVFEYNAVAQTVLVPGERSKPVGLGHRVHLRRRALPRPRHRRAAGPAAASSTTATTTT